MEHLFTQTPPIKQTNVHPLPKHTLLPVKNQPLLDNN